MVIMKTIYDVLNEIIDCLDPKYEPISDEELVFETDEYGEYQRLFSYKKESDFLVKWIVYYGNPDTVKTVFKSVEKHERSE